MNDALANTPMDERTTAQLQQRIQDLEQQLVDVQAHQVAVEQNARRDYATLLQGPFIIFRWIAVEGWPVEYVSENVQTLFGYAAEDFTSGRVAFASVVLPDDLERVFEEVQTYSASGVRSFDQEYHIVRSNGEIRWIYDFTAVNRNEDGVITHYYGYVLDITTRKQV